MNKTEFVEKVAEKTGQSKKATDEAVKAAIEVITEALANGDSVSFIGFGTFTTSERAAREGINPLTKKKIKIEATRVPKFKAGAALKQSVAK
jgi:Bacterial nucleoid DNA-binding protein